MVNKLQPAGETGSRGGPVVVADPGDPRLEPYRAVRDRDLAGRGGRFIAEGEVVVRTLLSGRSRFRAESLLVAEGRLPAAEAVLAEIPTDVPVYVAGRGVMDRVVGFPIHRGILAVGRRGQDTPASSLLETLPEGALVLGLLGISNHDNVGGAFRNAAAFGADAVLLDRSSCDPLYRKAIRVSVGACLTVPYARGENAASLVAVLEAAGFGVFGLSPHGRLLLGDVAWPPRTALLVGAEGPGLPPDLLAAGRAPGIVVVLFGVANHDNMGGIFRNAAAFGVKAVLLDSDCCDPLYRKAIRVSVGAALLEPFSRLGRGEDPLALLERHGFASVALSPAGSMLLTNLEPAPRNAILLGAEGPGLPSELMRRVRSTRIDMEAGFDSLNVATTSGIVLHHFATRRSGRPK